MCFLGRGDEGGVERLYIRNLTGLTVKLQVQVICALFPNSEVSDVPDSVFTGKKNPETRRMKGEQGDLRKAQHTET